MAGDDLIEELTAGMEVVKIPSDILEREDSMKLDSVDLLSSADAVNSVQPPAAAGSNTTAPSAAVAGAAAARRPWDDVREAGPAADPIPFPPPVFSRGRREDVLCYNPKTQKHDVCKNVLFRDYSDELMGDDDEGDGSLSCVQHAYWAIPTKSQIKTIMGHVNICLVLERCLCDQDDSSVDSRVNTDDEEDIVFKMTNRYVAVKVNYYERMERLRDRHAEDPLKEIAAMQLIGNKHPNVMGCIEVLFDGKNLNVVMPYCGSGDLFQLLQETQGLNPNTPGLTEEQARFWFRQVMQGLQYLHAKGICHRDLSPENLMLDGNGCLIIDMGMCIRIPYTNPADPTAPTDITKGTRRRLLRPQGTCGKLPYMSPEIYKNRDDFDGDAIDVWTAGTILFCMVTGNRSYQRPHNSDAQYYWMTKGLSLLLGDWGVPISNDGLELLKGMLEVDPRLRLTIDEVLGHRWFSGPDEQMTQARS